MKLNIQLILLLSLFSPLVELFPNLYMSWWTPSNNKRQEYIDKWPRRVVVVLTVWLPILIILSQVTKPPALIWLIGTLVFSAFGLRLYTFDRYIKQNSKKSNSPSQPSIIPEFLYFIAFTSIGNVLYKTVPNNQWLVVVGILAIFLGAIMMNTFRTGKNTNLKLDITGRLLFVSGFLINLYNLIQASSIIVLG